MLKVKNSKWTIEEQCKYDISCIKSDIEKFESEWLLDTSRQDQSVTHKQTNMYQIRFMDYYWLPGQPIISTDINKMPSKEAHKQLLDIFNDIEKRYDGKVVRVEIIKMLKNSKIRKHNDSGEMLNVTRRCHIPIITNDNVFFTVLENTINMKEGICYEINNGMPHSVENKSNLDRVHIIIDIMPNQYYAV